MRIAVEFAYLANSMQGKGRIDTIQTAVKRGTFHLQNRKSVRETKF